jgi:hypothetical protein
MKQDPHMVDVPYPLTEKEFTEIIKNCEFTSVIGHQDLARCLSKITGEEILYNRKGITLRYNDEVIVVYLTGRLPEHPTFVEYKNRINYSYIRFEKQSQADMLQSLARIEEMTKMEEI